MIRAHITWIDSPAVDISPGHCTTGLTLKAWQTSPDLCRVAHVKTNFTAYHSGASQSASDSVGRSGNVVASAKCAFGDVALVCFHIQDDIRHGISYSCVSLPMAVARVDPAKLPPKWLLFCMFHRLRSDARQLDAICALLEVQHITQVTSALMCVMHSPQGSRDSLSLWF